MRSAHRVFATVVAGSACLLATTAQAQPWRGRGGLDEMFNPSVNSEQMQRYARVLRLSADQAEVADALLGAYQLDFNEAAGPAREEIENIRDEMRQTRDRSMWEEMRASQDAFRKKSGELESQFFEEVKLLLSDEQLDRWPAFERSHRRETTIRRGMMSGERVDVVKLVHELELADDKRTEIDTVLERYEVELDPALVKRNDVYDDFRGGMRDMWRSGDMAAIEELFDKGRSASTRVRDINSRYARQVESLLADDSRTSFADAVRRASFPDIYRETHASRVIETVAGMEDLTDDQRESFVTIRDSFQRDQETINRRLETATTETEESMTPQSMFGRWGRGGGDDSPVGQLRTERRELEDRMIERLEQVLTEEQIDRLPERRQRGGRDGQRRRGRGGDRNRIPNEL